MEEWSGLVMAPLASQARSVDQGVSMATVIEGCFAVHVLAMVYICPAMEYTG